MNKLMHERQALMLDELGEVEGLQVSLAGVKDKLAQIDTSDRLAVDLGNPSLPTNARPR